ncbi:MAG TPA: S1C family serine protease [Planctomycetota bacterium]|nr:S1C family serine protease [Planctomycetota bacterium]
MRIVRGVVVLAAVCMPCGCALRPSLDGQSLYERVRRASVFVLANGRHMGSGFFATPDGLVVTSAHMVKGKKDGIEVVSPVCGRLNAERVAVDLGHDIALLRVPSRDEPYPWLPIAEGVPPPASEVLLFGDPVFRHRLLLTGFVSLAEPTYSYNPSIGCYTQVFYVAGTSPEGTSGGCWVDCGGRVVGVQSGFLNSPKAPAGIAMVAPPDAIRQLLATRASREAATLGTRLDELWTQSEGFIARFPKGTTGVLTVVPVKDGPVAKAGLTRESLITAIDGKPVVYVDDVMAAVRSKKPGDQVTLQVLDPGDKPHRIVTIPLVRLEE